MSTPTPAQPTSSDAPWRNRIVGYSDEPTDQLLANPANWRIHPKAQQDALLGLFRETGIVQNVLVNQTTGHLIDGHLRVSLALREGQPTVPVTWVALSEHEEQLILATLDPLAALAIADKEKLSQLMYTTKPQDAALVQMLADMAAKEGLYQGTGDAAATEDIPDPEIDKAAELQEYWGTAIGQVWEVHSLSLNGRRHRIVCGDSADPATAEQLLDGVSVDMGVTSPPYAVGKNYEIDVLFSDHLRLIEAIADRGLEVIKPGGFFFINFGEIAAQSHAGPLTGSDRQCLYLISADYWRIFHVERRYDLYAQRIWYKPFHRLQQPFWTYHTSIPHYQEWEHIWTWRLPGGEKKDTVYNWDISVRAVWDTRQEATDDRPLTRHTAAFPVGIPERAIKAHCDIGAAVWEPFLGSGTTMVVSERMKRVCYGSERDPRSVAVTLQRLHDMGLDPKLVAS